MIYFVSMMTLKVPTTSNDLGYRYNLDEQALCLKLQKLEACKRATDPETCMESLANLEQCEDILDVWVDGINTNCFSNIQDYQLCMATQDEQQCLDQLGTLYRCASQLPRPEWLMVPDLRQAK